jgi:hypothetical protein
MRAKLAVISGLCLLMSTLLMACGGEEVAKESERQPDAWYSKPRGEACMFTWQCSGNLVCRSSTGRESNPAYQCLEVGHWGATCLPNFFTELEGYDSQCAYEDHGLHCGQGLLFNVFNVYTCVYDVNI